MISITIRQMQYFEALAEALHFGRAAEAVGVTQPALSAQVAEMEERLGCRLFDRSGKAVRMTDEARAMQPRIARILEELRELETSARRGRIAMEGRFRLGIIPTIAPYLLPQALPELRRRFPALQLELREAVTDHLVEETIAGRLDAFIAATPVEGSGIVAEELFDDRFFLAVPASDPQFAAPPVPPESSVLERLMLLEEGHCLRDQALAFCHLRQVEGVDTFGASSLSTIVQMVANGMGLTFLPEISIGLEAMGGRVSIGRFADPEPSRTLGLAWRVTSPRKADFIALGKLVVDAVRQCQKPSAEVVAGRRSRADRPAV